MPQIIRRTPVTTAIDLPNDTHPVLKRIYAHRNIQSASDLDYSLSTLLPYEGLSNIRRGATLLADAIKLNRRIIIIADFDVDGATSCVLALLGLKMMGANNISYIVPNRFEFGYGLSPEIVELAATQQPDLLMTVDNGISSIVGVKLARDKGIDVLISDHHLPGTHLPEANVIINPNQPSDQFPSKMLAGVGVVFYVLAAVRAYLQEQQWFEKQDLAKPKLSRLLDLVALGTVADVVPMDKNNRLLVAQGLKRIRQGHCRPGITALLLIANRNIEKTSAQDLGFAVAPRLNAAGRLSDMSMGIECLLSDDDSQVNQLAASLDKLNRERRDMQDRMQQQALIDISRIDLDSEQFPFGVCLFNENWHQGIIGILAAKIKEKLHRPVIVFAKDKDGFIKGSARSIPAVHIRDVLDIIASQHPGLIDKFGGHAMAAGLSLKEADYEVFSKIFDQQLRQLIGAEDIINVLHSDGELAAQEINLQLAYDIMQAGPWGQGFPEPLFDGRFMLIKHRIVGENHLKMQLRIGDQSDPINAIHFNSTHLDWPDKSTEVHILYRLGVNEFNGQSQLQLIVENMESVYR